MAEAVADGPGFCYDKITLTAYICPYICLYIWQNPSPKSRWVIWSVWVRVPPSWSYRPTWFGPWGGRSISGFWSDASPAELKSLTREPNN